MLDKAGEEHKTFARGLPRRDVALARGHEDHGHQGLQPHPVDVLQVARGARDEPDHARRGERGQGGRTLDGRDDRYADEDLAQLHRQILDKKIWGGREGDRERGGTGRVSMLPWMGMPSFFIETGFALARSRT